ncbi:MAG: DUF1223 domain-containing protein [Terriglobales bacterium]|jgi:hypothetical protein
MKIARPAVVFTITLTLLLIFVLLMDFPGHKIAAGSVAAKNVAAKSSASGSTSPVLLELFTSEGCSSCPPADRLLAKLDSTQPIAGAQLIVLSEHVDHWDHDGWKDAYSSSAFTSRQEEYARRFGLNSAYTPQLVVDGSAQVVGSESGPVDHAIDNARGRAKVPVLMSSVALADPKTIRVHLSVDALPEDFKGRTADILVAVALDHAESHVAGGENSGRDLHHVAVAESISKVGTVGKGKNFDRDVTVKIKGATGLEGLRLIAFVQGSDGGDVVGASLSGADRK